MQNANADYLSELKDLQQDLAEAHLAVESLEVKLNLKELRDQEIEKLKKKAQEFEDYMRAHTRSGSIASSPSTSGNTSKTDASTETSDLPARGDGHQKYQVETKMRDDMAKIFASEIKTVEKRFREENERLQKRIIGLSEDLDDKMQELEVRHQQLELLKFTILSERDESVRLLQQKDDDFKAVLDKYHAEQQRVEELRSTLNEQRAMIQAERESIDNLKQQINDEYDRMQKRDAETLKALKRQRDESTKANEEMKEKCISYEKTAANWKRYSDDKEKHFRAEFERVKAKCMDTTEKIHAQLKKALTDKERGFQERINELEKEHEFKLDVMRGMLERAQRP